MIIVGPSMAASPTRSEWTSLTTCGGQRNPVNPRARGFLTTGKAYFQRGWRVGALAKPLVIRRSVGPAGSERHPGRVVAWCAFLPHPGGSAARLPRWASDPAGVLVTADAADRRAVGRRRTGRAERRIIIFTYLSVYTMIYETISRHYEPD
jgi:hypothetical protein